jgi:pseudouridine kinase
VEAKFVSMVDDTAMGRDVKSRLEALGIDTTHVVPAERGMGVWMAILDEHGDLRGSISRQPDFKPLEEYLRENGDALVAECDGIVMELDMNPAIADVVMKLAVQHEKPVYVVVGNMGVILRHPEYLRRVACFICNNIEAGRLFGRDLTALSPEDMLPLLVQESRNAGIPAMVLTMGAQGAVYVDHGTGEFGRCPAESVNMIDSTGAGDAFFTGTVAALARKMPLSQAVRVGTQLAARTLQVAGSSCPDARELLNED